MMTEVQVRQPAISNLAWSSEAPPCPPRWVREIAGPGPAPRRIDRHPQYPAPILLTARLERAIDLDADALRTRVSRLYRDLLRRAAGRGRPHPVRVWSFIPRIHEPLGPGISRYMAFNAGRHDALIPSGNGPAEVLPPLPASTGVGVHGEDLHLYCLASPSPGRAVENPRQKPAYRYSRVWGPLPPCFARATAARLGGAEALLVSGTAAVRGEDSVHAGSLERQLEETFVNLESLLRTAGYGPETGASLGCARVYHLREQDAGSIREAVTERFPGLRELEMVQAEICREELLVEIEGVASRDPGPP